MAARDFSGEHRHPRTSYSGNLHLHVHYPTPRIAVVAVSGDIDMASAPQLRELIVPRLDCAAAATIVDLSRTGFLGTAGLGLLLEAERYAHARGQTFILVAGPACVRAALRAAGLLDHFVTYPTLATAAAHVGEEPTGEHGAAEAVPRDTWPVPAGTWNAR